MQLATVMIVAGAQLQEPFDPSGGMVGPLPFKAVRQQQHQARAVEPLVLAACDELVDDHLRDIGEVAELRFPHHEALG